MFTYLRNVTAASVHLPQVFAGAGGRGATPGVPPSPQGARVGTGDAPPPSALPVSLLGSHHLHDVMVHALQTVKLTSDCTCVLWRHGGVGGGVVTPFSDLRDV